MYITWRSDPGRLRLRSRPAGGPLSTVPCADRRPVWPRAPGGHGSGRGTVYVRGDSPLLRRHHRLLPRDSSDAGRL